MRSPRPSQLSRNSSNSNTPDVQIERHPSGRPCPCLLFATEPTGANGSASQTLAPYSPRFRAFVSERLRASSHRKTSSHQNKFPPPLTVPECEELLGRYQSFGLIADPTALHNPTGYARLIAGEPVAISVCQILNDFKPADVIVTSLVRAATPENRSAYLRVALAQHCYSEGVRYSILQATLGPKIAVASFFGRQSPLQLAANVNENDFVTTLQAVLGGTHAEAEHRQRW